MRPLILASGSSARKHLLQSLKVAFEVVVPNIDETKYRATAVPEIVRELAIQKARAVSQLNPHAVVVASDQLVSFNQLPLGKPVDSVAAKKQLSQLSGRTHHIYTAICVKHQWQELVHVEEAQLTMHALSNGELDAYVSTSEWNGCAGSYRIESQGQWLFKEVLGDRTGIQGLPMTALVNMLREVEINILTK
jgi:septum formation protein